MLSVSIISNRDILNSNIISIIQERTNCNYLFIFWDSSTPRQLFNRKYEGMLVEELDIDMCNNFLRRLKDLCTDKKELLSLGFFIESPNRKFGLSRLRNLSELYLLTYFQSSIKRNNKILFMDDDVLPQKNFHIAIKDCVSTPILYGGYDGQPPFRIYWNDDLNIGLKSHIDLNVAINFSSDQKIQKFKKIVERSLKEGRFKHNLWYKHKLYKKRYFIGGTNLRSLKMLCNAPCLPANYRGYDDVFQSSFLYYQGNKIIFNPQIIFSHQKRYEKLSTDHIKESFFSGDLICNIEQLFYSGININIQNIGRLLKSSRNIRYRSYGTRTRYFNRTFGNHFIETIPSFDEVYETNNNLISKYFLNLPGWVSIVKKIEKIT